MTVSIPQKGSRCLPFFHILFPPETPIELYFATPVIQNIRSGVNVWPHELKTAQAFTAIGKDVEFIRRSEEQRTTSADAVIDGLVWEMKAQPPAT